MSAACICPDTPSLDEVATIPADPLRCGCCGSPLRLTCDGECGDEHVRGAFETARAQLRAGMPAGKQERHAPARVAWECVRCRRPIERRLGRPPKFCESCLTPAERRRIEYKREYNDQVRAKRNGVVSL